MVLVYGANEKAMHLRFSVLLNVSTQLYSILSAVNSPGKVDQQ